MGVNRLDQCIPAIRRIRCRQRPHSMVVRAFLLALAVAPVGSVCAGTATAVEFYNTSLRHYFITAYPEEAIGVDNGTAGPGWVRTGGQFTVYTDAAPGRVPVCRFYGTPGKGPNSHFYTADADECIAVKKDLGWSYESIAYYIGVPAAGSCPDGTYTVYRSYNDGYTRNDSNHRFTVDLTAQLRMPKRGFSSEGAVMCAPISDAEAEADAVRLLEQASLGPTEALVQEVKTKGAARWIDEQLALNVTKITQSPPLLFTPGLVCINDTTPPIKPENYCALYSQGSDPLAWEFYRQSKTAPDQLRMRMGHVWHQLFALTAALSRTYAIAEFQQRLRDRTFSTFEDLLYKFAVSPQMGKFQNWVKNVPEHDGIKPNENFARELLQLFTIGVNALNEDGTPKTDSAGRLVPTYKQADIAAMARILTGYSYPMQPGEAPSFGGQVYFLGDMLPFDAFHDQGAKSLFDGAVLFPAGGGAEAEVRTVLRALVDHANTPAFLSKQLIQKTVTSNPSPAYVSRVVRVFKDNGQGTRGDLAAVTRAILLDPEARGARKIDPEYGRMREPALFVTAMLRALDIATDGQALHALSSLNGGNQEIFNPPTVFGFYPADGTLLGSTLPAPEFGLFASSELLNRANVVNGLLYNADGGQWGPQPWVIDAIGTVKPALTEFLVDAANPETLINRLNRLFLHGTMSPFMRKTVFNAVNAISASDPLGRVKMAVNLILVSVSYQVQK